MHIEKLRSAEAKLFELKTRNGVGITPNEAAELLQLIDAENQSIKELKSQQSEYESFYNGLCGSLVVLTQLRLSEDSKKRHLKKLEKEFKLESKRFEQALPIYAKKSTILQTVQTSKVTILTAETGSGKSTQVVQYLNQLDDSSHIVCTQPRKVAATSLATRVSEELDSNVGELVGYRVGARSGYSPETKILYMTDQVLLNECLVDPLLKKYKYIIVDEAHERSIATDLLLAMIKKALMKRRNLRLIISSATINPKIFENYFQSMAVRIHVYGRTFPVDAVYEEVSIGMDYLQISIAKVKALHLAEPPGDVLVFLTTPVETERAQESIQADAGVQASIQCLVLHGRLQPEEQQLVFQPTEAGKRKIVFATNSAETSITIPNIRYVIDSGMVKEKQYDRKKNVSLLKIGPVNKSSAEQRMGRAGRTQAGKCYRLYTEDEYKAMADEMKPEILRENLGLAMLKLYQFDVGDPFTYDFVEAPPENDLRLAKAELISLEAIRDGSLTRYGEIMAALDLEPKLGKFVALALENDISFDAMVIAAVCSIGGSVFFRAGSEEDKQTSDRLKTRFCDRDGDLYTFLEVYKEWREVSDSGKSRWCVSNSMNAKSLRFSRDLVNDMKASTSRLCEELDISFATEFAPIEQVKRIVPPLMAHCFRASIAHFSGHHRGGYYRPGWGEERFYLHPSSSLSFLTTNPKYILFTEVLTTSRPYLINTICLPDRLAERVLRRGAIFATIKPIYNWVVGKELAKCLGLGRWTCWQEQMMQKEIDKNIYIDYDQNNGQVTLCTTPEYARKAAQTLYNAIQYERKWLDLKQMDIPLSEG